LGSKFPILELATNLLNKSYFGKLITNYQRKYAGLMSTEGQDRRQTFWSSVVFPWRQGISLLGVAGALFLYGALFYGLLDGIFVAVAVLYVSSVLWVFYRFLEAWIEWPARRTWVGRLKKILAYLLVDE
jgi:hypothetical protein